MTSSKCILVVDKERAIRDLLGEYFLKLGYRVLVTEAIDEAFSLVTENDIPVVLMELQQPLDNGMRAMARLKELDPDIRILLMTGYPTLESAICAIQNGAYYYIVKPFHLNELGNIVRQAMAATRWVRENASLRSHIGRLQDVLRENGVALPETATYYSHARETASAIESTASGIGVSEGYIHHREKGETLERLGTPRNDGLITEDEFQSKNTELLKRL